MTTNTNNATEARTMTTKTTKTTTEETMTMTMDDALYFNRKDNREDNGEYIIREDKSEALVKKIERLTKKAARCASGGIGVAIVGKLNVVSDSGVFPALRIKFTGSAPKLNGWTFVAKIDHAEDGNVLTHVPGESTDLPAKFRTDKSRCDHCKKNRKRNDTFVVREDATGNLRRIGRTCLREYIGNDDVATAIKAIDLLVEMRRWRTTGAWGSAPMLSTSYVLASAAAVVRVDRRFISRKQDAEVNTASKTLNAVNLRSAVTVTSRATERDLYAPTPEDFDKASAVIEWAKTIDPKSTSEYLSNIRAALSDPGVPMKRWGLVVSAIEAHRRDTQRIPMGTPAARSGYVGTVGDKVTVNATVTFKTTFDGYYGTTTLISFRLNDGRECKWFASNPPHLNVGDKVTVSGRVKKHDTYKGHAQTVLARCSVR